MPIELEMVLRILLAMVLGGILGFQRGKAEKPAGLRDLILICSGAALFTVVSAYGFGITDQARVAAGIVTGIGFLGAGVILRRDDSNVVKGLTTAATIWITAGIGMAAGSGMYILAVATTVMVFLVLILPWRLNKKD
ncbi:MAG TPA: magnesium transporter MgtC [Dehalococcoidia bacterium]|jgi:putative Mg2+ transporter-C (MgtC) family protein|nr:magnesium transporter MgtC [Dehalococcoidia bacterium]HAS27931.1 magnesium transporter MgtC [Dehalococcoidia bacterium]